MTLKQKARELVDKFLCVEDGHDTDLFCDECGMSEKAAQLCALIAVDEIINQYNSGMFDYKILDEEESDYWHKVKQEIEKL